MGVNGSDWQEATGDGAHFGGHGSDWTPPAVDDLQPSYGEYLGAQAGAIFHDTGLTSQAFRYAELGSINKRAAIAREFPTHATAPNAPAAWAEEDKFAPVAPEDAKKQVAAAGFPELNFGDGPTSQPAIDILLDRARRRAQRESIITAYQPSTVGNVTHQLLLGLADPANIGMSFIPYFGQARLATRIAEASTIAGRTGYRAAAGMAAGTQFMAASQPLTAAAMLQEGRDYTIADAVRDTIMGGAFGSGIHVLGGSVHDAIWGFPSKAPAPLPPGERPKIAGIPEPIPYEPNPVMRPPEEPKLSSLERMGQEEFFHAWVSGEVPFDTSSPYAYSYLTHTKEGKYVPFAERVQPQGIRQAPGFDGDGASSILSDIDLGTANGIQPADLVAHLVHQHALDVEPEYAAAADAWLREFDLRQQWGADWAKREGNIGPLLTGELSAIDFHNPQRPFLPRPKLETVYDAHRIMLQHSAAHALMMHQKVELAERSRLNAAPTTPAEIHDRLPSDIKTHALAAALADVTNGQPVRAAEAVKVLVQHDPELAASVDMLRLLKQDGPEFADIEGRTEWWRDRLSEKAPDVRASKGITGVLKAAGGIRDTAGTIRLRTGNDVKAPAGALITQKGTARTKRGVEIPEALELLAKEGFPLTAEQLHDALAKEWEGDSWTLPSDLAQRQLEFEARSAHNQEMLKAAGVAHNAKRSLQAERLAAYERELAQHEQANVSRAVHTLQDRAQEFKPQDGIVSKPISLDTLKQVATDYARAEILDERTAEIEKLANEAHERLKALGDEGLTAEIEAATKEITRVASDWRNVVESAVGCLYQPEEARQEAEASGITRAKPASEAPAERSAEPEVPRADVPQGRPGDMARERVADKLPKTPTGEIDEASVTRRLQARYGVDTWEELPRNRQNAIEKYGFPEDPAKPDIPASTLAAPHPSEEPTLKMAAGGHLSTNEMASAIRRRDLEVEQLEKTVKDRDELRRKISMADARFHEETLAHTLNQPFNPNKLNVPAEDKVPPPASRREELYRTITTTNDANTLKPVLDWARYNRGGNDFKAPEREYLDKLNRYMFRPAADGEPANSQVAAYLRMTDGKLNKPVSIEAFHKAYVERAREKRPGLSGAETVKDLDAFKRHLHLYGTQEDESFGNQVPDEPAVWLIKGYNVQLSPYIPGIEAARGHPEPQPEPKPKQEHRGWPKGKKRS